MVLLGRALPLGTALAALAFTGACSSPDVGYGDTAVFEVDESDLGPYRIRPGDGLQVMFAYHGERNQGVLVRPDGKFSIPLAEEIDANGRTVADVAADVEAKIATTLRDPECAVVVRSFVTQRVFVGGQVEQPGEIDLIPNMTLHQALMHAGWVRSSGADDSVILIRILGPGKRQAFKIDCSEGSLVAFDLELNPFDTIYVPRTTINRIAVWVRSYLDLALPTMLKSYGAAMLIRQARR